MCCKCQFHKKMGSNILVKDKTKHYFLGLDGHQPHFTIPNQPILIYQATEFHISILSIDVPWQDDWANVMRIGLFVALFWPILEVHIMETQLWGNVNEVLSLGDYGKSHERIFTKCSG